MDIFNTINNDHLRYGSSIPTGPSSHPATMSPIHYREKKSGSWQEEERVELVRIVRRHQELAERNQENRPGPSPGLPWTQIAKEHGWRTAKQCRERWDNHEKWLQSGVAIPGITPEVGEYIMREARLGRGKKWAQIGRHLNLPENSVKNFYYQEEKKRSSRESRQSPMLSQHQERRARLHDLHRSNPPYPYHPQHWSAGPHHLAPIAQPQQDALDLHYPLTYPSHDHRHARRQSSVSNPPSLASDHGSVAAESPRSIRSPYHSTAASPTMESWSTVRHHRSASFASHSGQTSVPATPRLDKSQCFPHHDALRMEMKPYNPRPFIANLHAGPCYHHDQSPEQRFESLLDHHRYGPREHVGTTVHRAGVHPHHTPVDNTGHAYAQASLFRPSQATEREPKTKKLSVESLLN